MSGRVTRRKRRAANSRWSDWVLLCSTPIGQCTDLRHHKWVANWQARIQMFGPFDDVKRADCGCEFVMVPASTCCEDCGTPITEYLP